MTLGLCVRDHVLPCVCVAAAAVMDLHCSHVLLSDAVSHSGDLQHPSASRQKDAELSAEVSTGARGWWVGFQMGAFCVDAWMHPYLGSDPLDVQLMFQAIL